MRKQFAHREALLSAEALRALLAYDPLTGEFRWRTRRGPYALAGSLAGKIKRGYVRIKLNRVCYAAHRLAWLYVHGRWPQLLIDHINRDRADNRIANLREATASQNALNRGPNRFAPGELAMRSLGAAYSMVAVKIHSGSGERRVSYELMSADEFRRRYVYNPGTGLISRRTAKGLVATGTKRRNGYIWICIDRRWYAAHRLAWLREHGRWPVSQIDHINNVRDDNRIINLREASPQQNGANRRPARGRPFKGVTRFRGRWQAQIGYRGRNLYLGIHDTPEQANAAYAAKASELYGEYGRAK